MKNSIELTLVITDLDGTLLDHNNYSVEPALLTIHELTAKNIPIIFNTSKTVEESIAIAIQLDLNFPLIVENGGAIVWPANYDFTEGHKSADWRAGINTAILGEPADEIIRHLKSTTYKLGVNKHIKSFSEMSVNDITALTGLSQKAAENAKRRRYSEPFIWDGHPAELRTLIKALRDLGLQVIRGGRFHHVIGQSDKRTAMEHLIAMYQDGANNKLTAQVIALGDSENDIAMLEGADIAVIVNNDAHAALPLTHPNLIRTTHSGPAGWREGMAKAMARLH